jgi:protein SHQ1
MITPQFRLDQTESHLIVEISVAHLRVSAATVEVVITDGSSVLHFCSPPYLLVLNLSPYQFADDAEEECAEYRPESASSTLILRLEKRTQGEHWENLHVVGRFLPPSRRKEPGTARWLQEVVPESPEHYLSADDNEENRIDPAGTTYDDVQYVESQCSTAIPSALQPSRDDGAGGYGFAHMFHDVLHQDWSRDDMAKEMLEGFTHYWKDNNNRRITGNNTDDPDAMPSRMDLRAKREQIEDERFSPERYLQDLDVEDDYVYQCAMNHEPQWRAVASCGDSDDPFNAEERRQLASIPYPLLPDAVVVEGRDDVAAAANRLRQRRTHQLLVGLVDLLFAYAYDHLTTSGEPTVESAWTVATLSCSLSWLDDPWTDGDADEETIDSDDDSNNNEKASMSELKQAIRSSLRRTVVYPYLRNVEFGVFCVAQVAEILESGHVCVIRCLLQMRAILHRSDLYYLSNKLYLDPYLAWLQMPRTTREFRELSNRLSQQLRTCLSTCCWKAEVGLDLIKLESMPLSLPSSDGEDDTSTVSSEMSSGSDATGDSSKQSNNGNMSGASVNQLTVKNSTAMVDDCAVSSSKDDLDSSSALLEREVLGTMEALSLSSDARLTGESSQEGKYGLLLQPSLLRPKGPLIQELD